MKKKWIIPVVIAVLALGGVLWYNMPVGGLGISAQEVSEIRIVDGNTGQKVVVADAGEMEELIDNFNGIEMKRAGISCGYMGYRFRIIIYTKKDTQMEFIVNSAYDVRKDPFFYRVEKGKIDFDFIQALFE